MKTFKKVKYQIVFGGTHIKFQYGSETSFCSIPAEFLSKSDTYAKIKILNGIHKWEYNEVEEARHVAALRKYFSKDVAARVEI